MPVASVSSYTNFSPLYASCIVLTCSLAAPNILSARPAGTKQFPQGHYLVPDTNALLNALDVFEQTSAFYDVIILQTVLEELRNRSLPLYNRLIGLTKSEDKRFYVFFNDFRLETHVVRDVGESINDRNDRAVRKAVRWYGQHLLQAVKDAGGRSKNCPAVVMLSDDKENLKKSKEDGIAASSLRDYVEGLEDADRLLDMLSAAAENRDSREAKAAENIYQEHYTASKMATGIKNGTFASGDIQLITLQLSRRLGTRPSFRQISYYTGQREYQQICT